MPRLHAPTSGTRIAVWLFPTLTMWLGLGYLFGSPTRFGSPAFTAAQDILPMKAWGLLFVAVAAVKAGCVLVGSGRGYVLSMCLGMGLYAWWAFLFSMSYFIDEHTSPGAPAWPLFVVGAHVAALSTLTGERHR